MKVLTVFGTRPEGIKMAPVVKELNKHSNINNKVCVTAQHRDMLDQVLDFFNINPDFDLNIMKDNQSVHEITINILDMMQNQVFSKFKPDIVLVHGDTTTGFVSALSAFYNKIVIGHVEAGLRTYNKYSPYPEEMNRTLISKLADLHFCPTENNRANLLGEGISDNCIFVTGNTVIDALKFTVRQNYKFKNKDLANIDLTKKIILVTAHRRENFGRPILDICNAIKNIANTSHDIQIIYPVHPNPSIKNIVYSQLQNNSKILLTEPLDIIDMHNLINICYLILTDSGGLQEEGPSLSKPVLLLRNETERSDVVECGIVKIVGTNSESIFENTKYLLENKWEYQKIAKPTNLYGNGQASKNIAAILKCHNNFKKFKLSY